MLTFAASEVGNGSGLDGSGLPGQDGGLAIRVGSGARFDDEGIAIVGGTSGTGTGTARLFFEIRDFAPGVPTGSFYSAAIFGTAENDTIDPVSRDARNYINGGLGNDVIRGGNDNDYLYGGAGDDILYGQRADAEPGTLAGTNIFVGGLGDDRIFGGFDDDTMYFNAATDGVDTFDPGGTDRGTNTVVSTGSAAAQIRLTFALAELLNGNNYDGGTLAGQDGGLAIRYQQEAADGTLTGGVSRFGDERMVFVGASGQTFDVRDYAGGIGYGNFDVAIFGLDGVAAGTITAQADRSYFVAGTAASQGQNLADVLIGTNADDFLVGNGGDDRLYGGLGRDALRGGDGSDVLVGGRGGDSLVGGAGIDTVSYEDSNGTVLVNLTLGLGFANYAEQDGYAGIENALGSNFADLLIGDAGVNRLDGSGGDDALIGSLGADVLVGGAGSDTASYEDNQGTAFVNLTLGRGYNNAAEGDTYEGIEIVRGGLFDDFFIGDAAANRLTGAMGADTLLGAGGADTFVFDYAPGATSNFGSANVDTILDFATGSDRIELSQGAFGALALGTLSASAFVAGTAATSADHRIIYNSANGQLLYDADGSGSGAAVLFAVLDSRPAAIAASDFLVVP